MNLLLIYGPPAVGKLTLAKELAKTTGYKLFHNHHTQDMIYPIFDYRSPVTDKLLRDVRLKVFETAMKNNTDIIFTFCFENPQHINFIKEIKRISNKHKANALFIRLYCNFKEQCGRVTSSSRKKYPAKCHSVEILKRALKEKNIDSRIDFVGDHLEIDTTSIPVKKIAEKIRSHHNLPHNPTDIKFRYS